MHFRLVPKSTTLDGREGHYALCFKTCAIVLYLFIVSFWCKKWRPKNNQNDTKLQIIKKMLRTIQKYAVGVYI